RVPEVSRIDRRDRTDTTDPIAGGAVRVPLRRLVRPLLVASLGLVLVACSFLPAARAPARSPSSAAMPVGDLPGRHQVFADDFNGNVPLGDFPNAVATKRSAYRDGSHHTSGNGTLNPAGVL